MPKLSTFDQFIEEDVNDPVMMKLRAAKHADAAKKQKEEESKRLRVYGARRQKMEDELDDIWQDIQDLKQQRADLYREMEMEAGQREDPHPGSNDRVETLVSLGLADQSELGNPWTDDDANQYGDMLNRIEDQIESLTKRAKALNDRLSH